MRTISARFIVLFGMSVASIYGQDVKVATISSTYPVTVPSTFAGTSFSTTGISVSYPVGLTPSSYVSGTQLNTDFQTYLGSYPNPTDPLEAILSTVLQSILNKYPQMAGGSLFGEVSGPCTPTVISGITIPCSPGQPGTLLGSVSVVIGTYSSTNGVITGLSRSVPRSAPAPAAKPVKVN